MYLLQLFACGHGVSQVLTGFSVAIEGEIIMGVENIPAKPQFRASEDTSETVVREISTANLCTKSENNCDRKIRKYLATYVQGLIELWKSVKNSLHSNTISDDEERFFENELFKSMLQEYHEEFHLILDYFQKANVISELERIEFWLYFLEQTAGFRRITEKYVDLYYGVNPGPLRASETNSSERFKVHKFLSSRFKSLVDTEREKICKEFGVCTNSTLFTDYARKLRRFSMELPEQSLEAATGAMVAGFESSRLKDIFDDMFSAEVQKVRRDLNDSYGTNTFLDFVPTSLMPLIGSNWHIGDIDKESNPAYTLTMMYRRVLLDLDNMFTVKHEKSFEETFLELQKAIEKEMELGKFFNRIFDSFYEHFTSLPPKHQETFKDGIKKFVDEECKRRDIFKDIESSNDVVNNRNPSTKILKLEDENNEDTSRN